MTGLPIREVAELTGIAAGTIRQWEQRYGFPVPQRTASGYRLYADEDVAGLRRVAALRRQGLSVPAAIDRAREAARPPDRVSLFAVLARTDHGGRPQVVRKRTLSPLARAIEHEALAHGGAPIVVGCFQSQADYRRIERRWGQLAEHADLAVVFSDFAEAAEPASGPVEVPFPPKAAMSNEWAVIVDAPGFCASLAAFEHPPPRRGGRTDADRRFEVIWTLNPASARRGVECAARFAAATDPALGDRVEALLMDRPPAVEGPAPALTALANRAVAYLDAQLP